MSKEILKNLCSGLPLNPLPSPKKSRNTNVPHAPDRNPSLTNDERKVNFSKFLFFFLNILQFLVSN